MNYERINYISKSERNSLLMFTFIFFCFVSLVITTEVINGYNSSVYETQQELESQATGEPYPKFSISNSAPTVPLLHLLTFLIFIALYKSKRFLLSIFLTIFYALIFIYGLSLRYNGARLGGEEFSPKVDFLDKVYRAATDFDYVAALFISILLFWQISILLRILIKTTQRKPELP